MASGISSAIRSYIGKDNGNLSAVQGDRDGGNSSTAFPFEPLLNEQFVVDLSEGFEIKAATWNPQHLKLALQAKHLVPLPADIKMPTESRNLQMAWA